ncbi:DUF6274 family protein [Streptomyces sparsus]
MPLREYLCWEEVVAVPTTPKPPRHATGALLRAHLSAAARYGHTARRCRICHRLQRLALEQPPEADGVPDAPARSVHAAGPTRSTAPAESVGSAGGRSPARR